MSYSSLFISPDLSFLNSLFHELSIIAEDESLMKKALKALKRLSAKKQAMDETEYIMSSSQMVETLPLFQVK